MSKNTNQAHPLQKHYACGFDTGNLHPKGFISPGIGEIYGMSYLDTNPLHKDRTRLGCFEYLSGNNSFLTENPLIWTGSEIPYCARTINSYIRVGDEDNGKVYLGLALFLGALTSKREHLRKEMHFHMVLSIVNAESVTDRLKAQFEGEHVVRVYFLNETGKEKYTDHKITIEVLKVVDEGASVSQVLQIPELITLDIGNRTAITTAFSRGKILNRQAIDESGVETLIKRIAINNQLKAELGSYDADLHEVRRAIESYRQETVEIIEETETTTKTGKKRKVKNKRTETVDIIEYRKKQIINIWEIYAEELQDWFKCELKRAIATVEEYSVKTGFPVRVIGGGALLPGLTEYFQNKGWTIAPNPLFVNAQGLCEIAEIMSGVAK
ncbi:MAG: hypothetical protein SAK29_37630 [Scytonema sp. PMC 1069.18]|nr:hypothetical protein [Scytonema sp. PMC 1069.18]MEC4884983.1 hypothetical protein [Scytonema sp. PMC 1070.18]